MSDRPTETLSLLQRWHDGDQAAFHGLIESHLPWIREQVRHRLGDQLRAREETGDFVQETLVEVLRDGPRFLISDSGHFRGLLAAIVENVIRTRGRAQGRQKRDVGREHALGSDSILDLDATSPSRAAARSEETAWLQLSIELMAPADREIIFLRQFEGLSFAEVGERIGTVEDTARVRFRRALARLAPIMKQLQEGKLGAVLASRSQSSS